MILSKKYVFLTLVLLCAIVFVGVLLSKMNANNSYEVRQCSDYGGTFDSYGPGSVEALANDYTKVIVVASVDNPGVLSASTHVEDPAPRIKIEQVIKGASGLHVGDTISLCSGLGYIKLAEGEHPTILVFLEGKDGDRWVPSLGYFGIVSKSADGRYAPDGITDGPKSVSLQELQSIIK